MPVTGHYLGTLGANFSCLAERGRLIIVLEQHDVGRRQRQTHCRREIALPHDVQAQDGRRLGEAVAFEDFLPGDGLPLCGGGRQNRRAAANGQAQAREIHFTDARMADQRAIQCIDPRQQRWSGSDQRVDQIIAIACIGDQPVLGPSRKADQQIDRQSENVEQR
ncbi:hypothetical protein D9M73_229150 [compost metagenome]